MKPKYLFILMICFVQMLMSQTMKVYKNDNTTIDFTLADVDSISFSSSPNGKLVNSSNWICFTDNTQSIVELASGIYEEVEDGLKVYGSGNEIHLMPVFQPTIMSKTIYLKWKVKGSGQIGVRLFEESAGNAQNLSAKLDVSGSSLNLENVWYYTRISVSPETITSVTSTGNYDNLGGEAVFNSSSGSSSNIKTFSLLTKANSNSHTILAESWIE